MNVMTSTQSIAHDHILVSQDNVAAIAKDYPFAVRRALDFILMLERGSLDVQMPDGRSLRFQGPEDGPEAQMIVHDFDFANELAAGGEVGIAEAFLKGHWESPNLTHFLELFCVNQPIIHKLLDGKPLVRLFHRFLHWRNRNTKAGSRRNIHAHYDLGNQFYSAWLDGTMTYSSALFTDNAKNLAEAQRAKYAALARDIDLQPGHHVLEIGCGWGGFAEYAAKEIGARVTGLTISKEQYDFATERMRKAGLSDRVEIRMQDYRDEKGVFDRIASIEMFEAVGEAYWPVYFRQLRDRLKEGGKAGLQVITIQDEIFPYYRGDIDFIRRYIFPGGMLPSEAKLREQTDRAGLDWTGVTRFGQCYADTLAQWRHRFAEAWEEVRKLGFDERFRKLWMFYLAYCEAGFRTERTNVIQLGLARA